MRLALTAAAFTLATLTFAQDGEDPKKAEVRRRGRQVCVEIYSKQSAALWARLEENLAKSLGSEDNLAALCAQLDTQLGSEAAVIKEELPAVGAGFAYVRTSRFEKTSDLMRVVCTFDDAWLVNGLTITPVPKAAESKHLAYETKTELHLPFEGSWNVFWGGRELVDNYHAAFADQRFAYDLMILVDGSSHTGSGKRNEDYHCFGKPVLAPGPGKIVAALDGIEDNVPGVMNPQAAAGNHVVIDHGNGEFSMLAHFKQGTVEAVVGDQVLAGDRLGLTGNSGNSSEAHIHYHLQTSPVWFQGEGLPTQFVEYLADGQPVERGEPVKGQAVRNQ